MQLAGVFVDVNNQYFATEDLKSKINYGRYLNHLQQHYQLYRCFAYGAQVNNEAARFITSLQHVGFETRYRPAIFIYDRQDIRRTDRKLMMACDIWRILDKLDVVVLGTNDPEIIPLVNRIQETGRQVVIFSYAIPRELKQACDRFFEVDQRLFDAKREPAITE